MDKHIRQQALGVLQDAEQSLRRLISKAALDQQYDDVTWIVELAKQIFDIRDRNIIENVRMRVGAEGETTNSNAAPSASRTRRSRGEVVVQTSKYPRFSAHDGRLVKTGWSKKKKVEYQHRAPKGAVAGVFDEIRQMDPQKSFDVDAVTPRIAEGNDPIPSYQIYMAIGWFRDIGYLEKCGRNEYRIANAKVVDFESLWQQL